MRITTLALVIASLLPNQASAAAPFAIIEQELQDRPSHVAARFEADPTGKHAWIELTAFWTDPSEVGPGYRGEVLFEPLTVRQLDQKGKIELVLNTGNDSSVICARSVWRDFPVNGYVLQDTGNCLLYAHLESRRHKSGSALSRRTFAVIELQVRSSL